MRRITRAILAAVAVLILNAPSFAQVVVPTDPPTILKSKEPRTRRDIDLRDSMHKYVHGLECMRDQKFHDALQAFEEAARLDPDSPAIIKAQLPILVGLDRLSDALAGCKKVVDLDPGDYSTWYVQAKLQRSMIRYADAITSLERGLKSSAIKERPEAAQQMYLELGGLYEHTEKFGPAADAFNHAAAILEHPDRIAEKAHVPIEAVRARAGETYERIGLLYKRAKQYDEAIAAFAKAQDRAPDRAGRINYLSAHTCNDAGRLMEALKHLDAYLRTQPLGIEPYEMKVELLRKLQQAPAIVPWRYSFSMPKNSSTPRKARKRSRPSRRSSKIRRALKRIAACSRFTKAKAPPAWPVFSRCSTRSWTRPPATTRRPASASCSKPRA